MRLLFINYEFPPVGGGAAKASLAAARELVGLGHRVDFLTIETCPPVPPDELGGVRLHTVRAHRRGTHDVGLAGAASFLAMAALRLPGLAARNEYDLYHYYFGLPTGLLTLVPGPHRRKPFVVSLRGSDVPKYDPRLATYHTALLPVTRHIWSAASAVIANSAGLRDLAVQSLPGRAIDVIHNGVHLPDCPRGTSQHGHCVRILAVSRLIERKGIDVLIRAVARLGDPRISVDIAGEGPERPNLEGIAQAEGLAGRIRFHGFADRAALEDLYRRADVFALTSHSESCSMALLDAIAWGLPAVATRVGGTPELIEHGSCGLLVQPGDVAGLSAALGMLVNDPAMRQAFGNRARRKAVDEHSWRAVATRYEAIFQAGIERHQRARKVRRTRVGTADPAPASRD